MEEITPLQQLDLGSCYTPACQYGYCGDEGLRFIHGFLPSNFGQEGPKCLRPNIGPRAKSVVRSTARPAGTVQPQTFTYHRYLNRLCSCMVSISVIQS